jgi:hypothetical protein
MKHFLTGVLESMNIEDIISTREFLAHELKIALSTMEMSDKIKEIRKR